jgi:hypothetical protein
MTQKKYFQFYYEANKTHLIRLQVTRLPKKTFKKEDENE